MSIKSLLQIILFLLIVIIIGGIYFLYFYSGPLKNQEIVNQNLIDLNKGNENSENITDQEILENSITTNNNQDTTNVSEIKEIPKSKNLNEVSKSEKKVVLKDLDENVEKLTLDKDTDKLENITRDIEYITSNKKGDTFKIYAENGKTNLKNNEILNLFNVKGTIITIEKSKVYISSKYAQYNYSNQNSKFFEEVEIKYDDKVILCDNLDFNISDNIAVAYNNVILKDVNSLMKAEKITMNIETKDISINTDSKIQITSN